MLNNKDKIEKLYNCSSWYIFVYKVKSCIFSVVL